MYGTNTDRCPAKNFELFKIKRLPSLRECGPRYLAVIDTPRSNVWYKTSRINGLNNMMKDIIKDRLHKQRKTLQIIQHEKLQ